MSGYSFANLVERPLPEIESIRQYICLAYQGQLFLLVALTGIVKGKPEAPFHSFARIDRLLDGYFVRGPFLKDPA